MGPQLQTNRSYPNPWSGGRPETKSTPQLRRVARKLPSMVSFDKSNRGSFNSPGPHSPLAFSTPAPLTARSLSTHLNQMQQAQQQAQQQVTSSVGMASLHARVGSPPPLYTFPFGQQQFSAKARSVSQANSDAPSAARRSSGGGSQGGGVSSTARNLKNYGAVINPKTPHTIEALLSKQPQGNIADALKDLRYLILTEGIPADPDGHVGTPQCLYWPSNG